jgi:hypothetical protein
MTEREREIEKIAEKIMACQNKLLFQVSPRDYAEHLVDNGVRTSNGFEIKFPKVKHTHGTETIASLSAPIVPKQWEEK